MSEKITAEEYQRLYANKLKKALVTKWPTPKKKVEGTRVYIKPLSVNEAWKGRRMKTDKYIEYSKAVLECLPKVYLPRPLLAVHYHFGLSSKSSDWDNCIKEWQDLLSVHYGFNDNEIMVGIVSKEYVKKGYEFAEFTFIESKEQFIEISSKISNYKLWL
jgi:Holliday junction resolvase RusA-like endonuclease